MQTFKKSEKETINFQFNRKQLDQQQQFKKLKNGSDETPLQRTVLIYEIRVELSEV